MSATRRLCPRSLIIKYMKKVFFTGVFLLLSTFSVHAQSITMRIDAQTQYQRITGFGGFVCSPQFGYNHMSQTDMKKVWGKGSTLGCNIMRLYIPIGRNSWSQSLQTAKYAKQLGLIVFASPWGQPAEWKTNGTINAKNSDGTTGKLKRENWADYAKYLDDYVVYLRNNGVELDAISIQNEPDWPATYAGCLWSASEIAEFVRTYGRQISCKIMAPETLAVSDSYVNSLNTSTVLPCFDIYGGHLYGGMQSAFKKLAQKGKEIWMTEYLINWNENASTTRNFSWEKDAFNFAHSINDCMLNDFNAWVHYAAKRFYGMLGDGQYGTSSGVVTKRGLIMAHYSKYVTGMTRIESTWNNESSVALEGSAYLSTSGDTVVAVIINPSNESCTVKLDLPFFTQQGTMTTTSQKVSMKSTDLTLEAETCRPLVDIPESSISTILFTRSRDRQPSQMKGEMTHFDKIEDQTRTTTNFGTAYRMSNKTVKFDHSNPLISTRTTSDYGFLKLNDRYSRLVMKVKKVTSTLNYTSALTTLYYVNKAGQVSSHDYGELDLNRKENFNLVFDLSPNTLKDGCRALIGMTNNNWSSTLTITFGDVYLATGNQYAGTLSGVYGSDDSYLLDFINDPSCTSINMKDVSELPNSLPFAESNRIIFFPEGVESTSTNVVIGGQCNVLRLTEHGGDFRPADSFEAKEAIFTCDINSYRMMMLPFETTIPQDVNIYTLSSDGKTELITDGKIQAHHPVLVEGQGHVTFTGAGIVAYSTSPIDNWLRGTYTQIPLYANDYVLGNQGGQWGFIRLTSSSVLNPFDVYAQFNSTESFIPLELSTSGIAEVNTFDENEPQQTYNLLGQRVKSVQKGLFIVNGKKYMK